MNAAKAKILTVGDVVDNVFDGWSFDCKGSVPIFTVLADGDFLIAGYTPDELRLIANFGHDPEESEER